MSPSVSETGTSRDAANSERLTFRPPAIRALSAYLSSSFSSFSGFRLNKKRGKIFAVKSQNAKNRRFTVMFKTQRNIKLFIDQAASFQEEASDNLRAHRVLRGGR